MELHCWTKLSRRGNILRLRFFESCRLQYMYICKKFHKKFGDFLHKKCYTEKQNKKLNFLFKSILSQEVIFIRKMFDVGSTHFDF